MSTQEARPGGASAQARAEQVELIQFSVVRDDLAFRLQRRLGLIPAHGLGVVRRALFWSLLAWLPIAIWAVTTGRAVISQAGEPLLAHFGIQVRFLFSVPLLIVGEAVMHAMLQRTAPQFVASGMVPDAGLPALRALVQRIVRLRNASLPWIAILGVVLAVSTVAEVVHHSHEIDWALEAGETSPGFGFGAWWFLYVARPIYLTLVLAWLWRLALLSLFFRGLARLDLALVPGHPDRAGGLGFLAGVPAAFAPVVLAVSAVFAAQLAHDVVYHAAHVASLRVEMGAFVVMAVAAFLAPMVAFVGPLARARKRALLDYDALVSRHGRLVHERWIEGRQVGSPAILDAPELGPVADVAALYEGVTRMRSLPLSKASVAPLLAAAILPMIPVVAIEVPVVALLKSLVRTLL
jgi:hypothetical protein